MKISKHLRRKINFISNSYDAQEYEWLQNIVTIENYSSFYSKKTSSKNHKDCFKSKRKEDKILEDILDGKNYKEMEKDLEIAYIFYDTEEYINNLPIEKYLLALYSYDIKTRKYIWENTEENCNNCKFGPFCKEVR